MNSRTATTGSMPLMVMQMEDGKLSMNLWLMIVKTERHTTNFIFVSLIRLTSLMKMSTMKALPAMAGTARRMKLLPLCTPLRTVSC